MSTWVRSVVYRLRQGRQQLGFVHPLSCEDEQEVQRWLPTSALSLFATMSNADKQHSLRVCRGLQAQGCVEHDMLAAALLHDVGKAEGRVPFWTRPVVVLGKLLVPRLLTRIVVAPSFVEIDVLHPHDNDFFVGTRCIASVAQFIERNLYRPCVQIISTMISRDKSRNGRDTSGPYENCHINNGCFQSLPTWRRSLSYAWFHADVGADLAANVGLSERTVLYIRTHHDPHGPAAALHRVDEVS